MSQLPNELNLYFDGGCRPRNPGGIATSGWFMTDSTDKVVAEGAKVVADGGPKATNNYAEYCALGLGIRHLIDEKWTGKSLTIRGDSRLIVEQVAGNWRCKAEYLKPLLEKIKEYLGQLDIEDGWSIHWVGREYNNHAHTLAENVYNQYRRSREA